MCSQQWYCHDKGWVKSYRNKILTIAFWFSWETLHYINHYHWGNIDGLVQERCNSIANTLELHLSCTNPSISTCCLHRTAVFLICILPLNILLVALISGSLCSCDSSETLEVLPVCHSLLAWCFLGATTSATTKLTYIDLFIVEFVQDTKLHW